MRFGYWLPVFGGWLRNVADERMEAEWAYVRKLARASERAGFDLTLIAELNLNDIKGTEAGAAAPAHPLRRRRVAGRESADRPGVRRLPDARRSTRACEREDSGHAGAPDEERPATARLRRRRLRRVSRDRNGRQARDRADHRCPAECRGICELRTVARQHAARAAREPGGLVGFKSRPEGGTHGNT